MKKIFFVLPFFIIITGILFVTKNKDFFSSLQANIFDLVQTAETAGTDTQKWENITEEAKRIPAVYPLSIIRNIFLDTAELVSLLEEIKQNIPDISQNSLQTEEFFSFFEKGKQIQKHLKKIEKNLDRIPKLLLNSEQETQIKDLQSKVTLVKNSIENVLKFENIFQRFSKKNDRILILFQNENEPRSTGGFVGSIALIDFSEPLITWKFSDIYALDRLVPNEIQPPSPDFFHDLSQVISLRDANFWPNFPTTAKQYQQFFSALPEEQTPNTIIALNVNIVRELLRLTGSIHLPKWDITANQYNVDLVLEFLVESKIAGRFSAKEPVFEFMEEIFNPQNLEKITQESISQWDHENFIAQKNILAYSENTELQKLFQNWNIDGSVKQNSESDNFLYFDFISVGANKSEKFVWTKIWHDSKIKKDGTIKNFIEITRNHALKSGEISELLNTASWHQNVRDLINDDILWKLGAGQNRTVLRIFVPHDAKLLFASNPSGRITENFSEDKKFKIFEVPAFVSPGEKIKIELTYETKIERGSAHWRPYFLQLIGTAGRDKTSFLSTISTEKNGSFKAETMNIGKPQNLIDSDFRSVIEFQDEAQ